MKVIQLALLHITRFLEDIELFPILAIYSMSKNPFGNEGFEVILDALIAKPSSPLKKLG